MIPKSTEDVLDDQFFKGNGATVQKMKLNKGEKRALKFLIQKQTGQQNINVDEFLKTQDIQELKNMLAKETKKHSGAKESKTGMAKREGYKMDRKAYDFTEENKAAGNI